MSHESNGYGLWPLVMVNTAVFVIFALSFTRPRTARDWRSLGAFSAFIVALFTEMYRFPLSIYLLSGVLGSRYPAADPLSHDSGHLWNTLFGWGGDPHAGPLHLLSYVFIGGGLILVGTAWRVLHRAQSAHELATSGPYRRVRHPQYVGFVLIMLGFLLQWPTIPTLLMFPILVFMYVRLARHEEREASAEFGVNYVQYAETTPSFVPRLTLSQGHHHDAA
jgi:protein-S-isoprenylcysteine O-methyltransferase Ste14